MPVRSLQDPVLSLFRSKIDDTYGSRIERVILFGSRARDDAQPDSDYDVAVFLRDMADRAEEMDRLADIGTEILYDSGKLIHALPFHAAAYQERTPLMHEVRKDGVDL